MTTRDWIVVFVSSSVALGVLLEIRRRWRDERDGQTFDQVRQLMNKGWAEAAKGRRT